LQECCKCREKLFEVCRNAANATKNFSGFAGMLQTLMERKRKPPHLPFSKARFEGVTIRNPKHTIGGFSPPETERKSRFSRVNQESGYES